MGKWNSTANEVFLQALEHDSPGRRRAYLDGACGADTELRAEVESLLAAHARVGGFLESPALGVTATLDQETVDQAAVEQPGSSIGRYQLLELIGEGGFGDVYLAEQQEPIRRQVALKIIKLGMNTRAVIARFEAERQALALMDHPNIAKVLDAGATETGRPYFVMELVRGVPITEYCDAHDLATGARLQLFIDVCRAVQHAHQKGIIHRDLKPNNVLVTEQDGKPVPKIIDFGVAKATQQRLTERTLFTERGQLIGTPEYMSPEQATFCETDVDTRSDVYSLGVLLYELLVDATPFDAEALRGHGYDEICRVIRELDPPTPSKRLSGLEDVVEVAKHRHVEPAALRKLLRGDLDWIVMKCLEKDRTRRYETVHSLARDIERHLSDEPVRARPPSAGYRLQKFVRKYRVAVAVTVAVVAALALGLARAEHQRRIADDQRRIASVERSTAIAERDQARENLLLARQLVSDVVLPAADRMSDFRFARAYIREVLEKARVFNEQILAQSAGDPEPRREMAQIHFRLGKLAWDTGQDAEPALLDSLSILKDLASEYPHEPDYRWDLSQTHDWLAVWYGTDMRHEEAVQQRRLSLGILEELLAQVPSNEEYRQAFASQTGELGFRLARLGRLSEAEEYIRATVTDRVRLSADVRVISRADYGYLLFQLARYGEAEQVLQEALAIAQQEISPGASPPNAKWGFGVIWQARCHRMLGLLSFYTARFADAEEQLREAIDLAARVSDDLPLAVWLSYYLGWWHHDLAEVLTARGRLEEAEAARRQSLAAWESAGAPVAAAFSHGKGLAHYRLGELLHLTGRSDEAARQFTAALAIMEDLARRRPEVPACQWQIVCLLANCPDPAFRDLPRAVALARRALPPQAGHYWRYLALAQYRSGQWQDAADSIQQAMDLRQGGDAFDRLLLAMADWQLGDKEEAHQRYTQAQEAIEAGQPIYYEHLGIMSVDRLRSEAEMLLGGGTVATEQQ